MGPRPLPPLRGAIAEPSFANQRCVLDESCNSNGWCSDNITCSFADTSVALQTDSTGVSGGKAREEWSQVVSDRVSISAVSSRICDQTTPQDREWGIRVVMANAELAVRIRLESTTVDDVPITLSIRTQPFVSNLSLDRLLTKLTFVIENGRYLRK